MRYYLVLEKKLGELKQLMDSDMEAFFNAKIKRIQQEIRGMAIFPVKETVKRIYDHYERIIQLVELRDRWLHENKD